MSHSCSYNNMAGTSTPYEAGGEAGEIWIHGHGNALEAQGHHGEPIVRSHDAPVVPDPRHAGFGQGGAGLGYEGGVRGQRGRTGDGAMGEAQTMREKGEVWGSACDIRRGETVARRAVAATLAGAIATSKEQGAAARQGAQRRNWERASRYRKEWRRGAVGAGIAEPEGTASRCGWSGTGLGVDGECLESRAGYPGGLHRAGWAG